MKREIVGIAVIVLCVACGGGDAGTAGVGGVPGVSGEPVELDQGQLQVAMAVRNAVSNPDAPSVVKSMAMRDAAAYLQNKMTPGKAVESSLQFDCKDGGDIRWSFFDESTLSADGTSGIADLTVVYQFNECTLDDSTLSTDEGTCQFDMMLHGSMTCGITGTLSDGMMDISVNCGTATSCDGLEITLNGEEHSYGFAMSGSASSDELGFDPLFGEILSSTGTGEECVDGVSFAYGAPVSVADSVAYEELTCSE